MGDKKQQEEIGKIAERLAGILVSIQQLQTHETAPKPVQPLNPMTAWDRTELLADVKRHMRMRDMRASLFDTDLVGEHAWNMLLFCFSERLQGEVPTVTAVCAAAHAPPTTASRHLQAMTDAGLLTRTPDPNDARRGYVELTEETEQQIHHFFDMARTVAQPTPLRSIMTGPVSELPVKERLAERR